MYGRQSSMMKKDSGDKEKDVKKVELGDYLPGDEAEIVKVLSASGLLDRPDKTFWRWKHIYRPGFTSWNVKKAYLGKKVVGCWHTAILNLKLDDKLEMPVCFAGDVAVLPEWRGRKIPHESAKLINARLREEGIPLRAGFSSPKLYERVYKGLGDVLIPSISTEYTKIIGLGPLKVKVEEIGSKVLAKSNIRRILKNEPLIVDLQIENLPPCHLELTGHGFSLCEGYAQKPRLGVRIPYSILVSLTRGSISVVRSIAFNLLWGRLRIRGFFRNSLKLLELLWSSMLDRQT
jgi:hypothetical protein